MINLKQYGETLSTIAGWKKGPSNSQIIIDYTARFCSSKALDDLHRTQSVNRLYEKIDRRNKKFVGIISIVYLITKDYRCTRAILFHFQS